ncbi:hypothetical protein [Paramagnetospirillum magneticum]|uniref:Uncharacterized protein n=1 Tax=Paramagnetospirillum magneticum (strain ATCC 700264 / AMB-1) TaxID=342108 RepID=Q2W761_PARM1|nr:hypothetical protein [Paramagnetospirillum magneticum]BAE50314.1 hypothetical protein amb1510 [Paramagnetospirillum magneticum AMB-1]
MSEPNALVAHVNAIAATVGIAVGVLRAKGVLTEDEAKMVFILARSVIPESMGADAAKAIQAMEITASQVSA